MLIVKFKMRLERILKYKIGCNLLELLSEELISIVKGIARCIIGTRTRIEAQFF